MRTRIVALLALAAFASVAADGDVAEQPEPVLCDESSFAPPLTTDGFSEAIAAPNAITGQSTTTLFFTVDLGPDAHEDTRGTLSGTLTWLVLANDYDLSVNGTTSDNFQPFDPAEEFASSAVAHCQIVGVSAIDFTAPADVEDLQLDLTLTRND